MNVSSSRLRAIYRKELREYRRNGSIVWGMAILPLIFLIQPLVQAFAVPSSASGQLTGHHELLYLLAIPALCRRRSPPSPWWANVSRERWSRCSPRRSAARSFCWARPWRCWSRRL